MAVYKRTYTAHDGPTTPLWSRFLIPARYTRAKLTKVRFLMTFMILSLFYPLGCLIYVYLSSKQDFMASLGFPPFDVDSSFFFRFCRVQGTLAFLLTAFASPSLISWDISNGALQLYFCRPFSRLKYVLAKLAVLFPLLSIMTWIPAAAMFIIKTSISPWEWTTENFWIGRAVFVSLFMWAALLSMIGLSLSSLVKQRIAAGAIILGVFFGGAGFASVINNVMNIEKGSMIDLFAVSETIWADLLHYDAGSELSVSSAWIAVAVVTGITIWILNRRIRSFEVIK
jgi:ABC-type transport system involved in multi-copper enzyme maturation permease subunit